MNKELWRSGHGMPQIQEQVFLITYQQNGLLMRDRFFEEAEPAQQHLNYLQRLFPESQVQLHVLSIHSRLRQNCCQSCLL